MMEVFVWLAVAKLFSQNLITNDHGKNMSIKWLLKFYSEHSEAIIKYQRKNRNMTSVFYDSVLESRN